VGERVVPAEPGQTLGFVPLGLHASTRGKHGRRGGRAFGAFEPNLQKKELYNALGC
jgi:hypothetical protein